MKECARFNKSPGRVVIVCLIITCFISMFPVKAADNMPDREERIYTLSYIWKEMQYNFAFPETLREVNQDSLYRAYLPKVEQVKDNYEYYRVLSEFMAHFNEAHTRVLVFPRPDDMPPVFTTNFGEQIVIYNISDALADQIPVGSRILKVNGIPAAQFVRDSVCPYVGAATDHWKFDRSVIEMLYGVPFTTVHLLVKTPEGKEREVDVVRNYYSKGTVEKLVDTEPFSPVHIQILDDNIGYIELKSCQWNYLDTIQSVFTRNLPALRNSRGLIIDVRGNRGGTDQAWEFMAKYLLPGDRFQLHGKWLTRKHITSYRMWGERTPQLREFYLGTAMEEINHPPYKNEVNDSLKLTQPLVIISGLASASATEDFLLVMKTNDRGLIVGEPSVGCVGEPMVLPLPGNYDLMMCAKKYVYPDGSQPNDTGILPDIEVKRDYQAYLEGRDNILERAIEEVRKQFD